MLLCVLIGFGLGGCFVGCLFVCGFGVFPCMEMVHCCLGRLVCWMGVCLLFTGALVGC